MTTNVYVDAFNLYYRSLKGTRHKWLDLAKLCALLLPSHDIQRIKYFTAIIEARNDPKQQQRQQAYLRALRTSPNLTIHLGSFLTNPVRLPLADPQPGQARTVRVLRTEEKGSDVNLATHLLVDGFRNDYNVAVVLSNDSDLRGPIEAVRRELRRDVGVIIPGADIRRSSLPADFYRRIRTGSLAASQFPRTLHDEHGTISKPQEW